MIQSLYWTGPKPPVQPTRIPGTPGIGHGHWGFATLIGLNGLAVGSPTQVPLADQTQIRAFQSEMAGRSKLT